MSEILQGLLLAVDDQLRSAATPYVKATYERLRSLGLGDEQAREEIGDCLGQELDEMLEKKRAFDETAYRSLLDALPWQEEPMSSNDLGQL
jgi:hypothetical protein